MQKQPKLIGKKTVTGGSITLGVGLVILYVQLIISSSTVDILVERFGLSFMHIGADKTDVQLTFLPFTEATAEAALYENNVCCVLSGVTIF